MKAVIQRVTQASVTVEGEIKATIQQGLLVLLGVAQEDTAQEVDWICKKITQMRIFSDEVGKMNLSLQDVQGELLIISQFTLLADTKKGNRPSFTAAAPPAQAIPLYEKVIAQCEQILGKEVKKGVFGADMKVNLLNDGPVTIYLDSQSC